MHIGKNIVDPEFRFKSENVKQEKGIAVIVCDQLNFEISHK